MGLFASWKFVLAALVVGFFSGGFTVYKFFRAGEVSMLEAQIKNLEEQDKNRQEHATKLEKSLSELQDKKEVRYVEVKKFIDRPVYRNCAIDDDGMLAIREAVTATNAARERAYAD